MKLQIETEQIALRKLFGKELFIPEEIIHYDFNLRGGFKKKILFITQGEGVPVFIPEIELMFQRMINNLKSNENEIGILDLKFTQVYFSNLKRTLQPKIIISFGINTADFGLHMEITKNKIITTADFLLLPTDSFAELFNSDVKKKELFPQLKQLFSP